MLSIKTILASSLAAATLALMPVTTSAAPAGLGAAQPETETIQVKFKHHHHHHHRHHRGIYLNLGGFGFYDGMSCREIYWRARNTGSPYWWRMYRNNCL